ncbi:MULTISPECIES: hypothetical protein [unclassified Rhodococcus (in: high G+C Gram-positive bacteria)]|uniref:hypothetical protein n=1 Tax=Rhodococcus sp. SJ-3 TaxID=3454628 RepID=UPI003F798A54
MSQLSFFGADTAPPALSDLSGLLASQGRIVTRTADSAQITVTVEAPWRASAIADQIIATGLTAAIDALPDGSARVCTSDVSELVPLATAWSHGGSKRVPAGWVPSAGALRAWFLAAGRVEVVGERYVLGLDPNAPRTYVSLSEALMVAGIAPTLISPHGAPPGLRVSGPRRIARLAESIGAPPDDSEARAIWPRHEHFDHHM